MFGTVKQIQNNFSMPYTQVTTTVNTLENYEFHF